MIGWSCEMPMSSAKRFWLKRPRLSFLLTGATKPIAGPAEATVLGNLLVQALAPGALPSLDALRAVVRASVPVAVYEPGATAMWDEAYERFRTLVHMREELR